MTLSQIRSSLTEADSTTKKQITQDSLFMTIVQSYAKTFIAKVGGILQSKGNVDGKQINAISTEISSGDFEVVLNAVSKLADVSIKATETMHPAYASQISGFELLLNYDEACQFLDITRKIFNINVDSTYTSFTFAGAGEIFGNNKAKRGDGTDKLSGATSWSGVDMVIVAMLGEYVRTIPDFTTISFSINRNKVNVHALGSVNRKGHTGGPRTVAGTMIGLVLKDEPLKGLQPSVIEDLSGLDQMGQSASPYREFLLPDQLPDFDLLVTIQNEMGHTARIGLFGITITDTSQVISINDTQTETQYTYTATDIDLLTYEGSAATTGTSFSLSLEAFKERRNRITSGRSTHNSPFDVPEYWDVWDPDKRIMLEPQDMKVTSDEPLLGIDPGQNIIPINQTKTTASESIIRRDVPITDVRNITAVV